MFDPVTAAAATAGICYGIARIITAACNGRATVIRAKRGDPEPDRGQFTVSDLFRRRDDP